MEFVNLAAHEPFIGLRKYVQKYVLKSKYFHYLLLFSTGKIPNINVI